MPQTIAQQIKWDFETNGALEIRDKNDKNGKPIYYERSDGFWVKNGWDFQGKLIYLEDSNGTWLKYEYDSKGNQIYYEDSCGVIKDQRPKPCESKEIVIEGVKYKLVKA